MFTLILTTTVLAVLYGLAWHNEPARARQNERREPRRSAGTKT